MSDPSGSYGAICECCEEQGASLRKAADIDDHVMLCDTCCAGLSAEVDFKGETRYLREWVNGGGVPTAPLREELAKWLVRMSASPSRAINTLALAMADEERASSVANGTVEDGAT